MDKLKMHSPDITQQNIKKLLELFPNCKTEKQNSQGELEAGIDFDLLKQELSKNIVEGPQERYQLNWPGKREALLAANAPIAKTLRPCREESVNFDTTQNLFIEGDNLDALKLLQENYLGKVKMIYIDPPYNTGKDFIYDDDFSETSDDFLKKSNQKDGEGNRLIANTDANGRFHSDWMTMIYSRLKLARNLLKDDGVIFISIDDNEIHHLRSICDELFGSSNFIANIIWHKMDSPKNSAKYLSEDHDYILLYAKSANDWRPNLLPRSDKMIERYQNPDNDPRGPWLLGDLAARNFYSKGTYAILTPSGKVIDGPPAGSYWRISEEKFKELNEDGRIWWGKSGENRPGVKKFLSEVRSGVIPQTYWNWKDVGSTRNAKQALSKLLKATSGDQIFVTPKPVGVIERMLQIATNRNQDDIVLDFFAGSGSTAHAVMEKNSSDSGNRKWISVQLPEFASEEQTISDMCIDRIRFAGDKIQKEKLDNTDLDTGFRVLKVDSSNMNDVYYTPDAISKDDLFAQIEHIKDDRSDEDLLFQVLLDWGVDLSLPIQQTEIQGKRVFLVDAEGGMPALAACFDKGGITEELIKELAGYQPLRAVFRDDGFVSDAVKINAEQIFKQLAPNTDIKAI